MLWVCWGAHGRQATADGEGRALPQGAGVTRKMRAGERHLYSLTAGAGEFVSVTVARRSLDLKLTLRPPGGERPVTINSLTGWSGTDEVFFVAAAAGVYLLSIEPAAPGDYGGEYTVRWDARRPATEADVTNSRAVSRLADLAVLFRERPHDVASLNSLASSLEEVAGLFRAVGNLRGQYAARLLRGRAQVNAIELKGASESYAAALELARNMKDDAGAVAALGEAGSVLTRLGRREEGLASFKEALSLAASLGDELVEGRLRHLLCGFYNNTGLMQEALDQCRLALTSLKDKDPFGAALILNMLGNINSNMGNVEGGQYYYENALAELEQLEGRVDPLPRALVISNLAGVSDARGEFNKALDYYSKALGIIYALGQTEPEYEIREVGSLYGKLGNYPEALKYLGQALAFSRKNGETSEEGLVESALGDVYAAQGDWRKALESYTRALDLSRLTSDRYAEASALYKIARAERARGNLTEAREAVEAALRISEGLRANVFSKHLRTQFSAMTRSYHELYVDVLMRLGLEGGRAGMAEAALEANERGRARTLLEFVVVSGADPRGGVEPGLLEKESRLRARLSELDRRLRPTRKGTEDPPAPSQDVGREIVSVSAEYETVQETIRRANPRYSAFVEPHILSAAEIRAALDEETLLLEYALGRERSYCWAVTRESVSAHRLPPREEIEAAARAFYESLQKPGGARQAEAAGRRLYSLVLAPIRPELRGKRLVAVVSEGALQLTPFAALPAPSFDEAAELTYVPLVTRYEVVNLPSASTLVALRQAAQRRPAPVGRVAVLADPVFSRDDERLPGGAAASGHKDGALVTALRDLGAGELARLPFSRIEASDIIRAAGGGSLLAVGFDATRSSVLRGDLSRYRHLHFATHGLLNPKHPDLSGIVLTLFDRTGRGEDGFLRAQDIYTLNLRADLAVLSACQTALGKDVSGEGLIGLSRAFMYAGVPRVASTLWKVDDEATAVMMRYFYVAMLKDGKRPSTALREAQLQLLKTRRWGEPFYWAGFTLHGDWR